jgi:hypothetical protein
MIPDLIAYVLQAIVWVWIIWTVFRVSSEWPERWGRDDS